MLGLARKKQPLSAEAARQEFQERVNKVLLAAADDAHDLSKTVDSETSSERAYHTWVLHLVESIKDVYRQ